MDSPLSAADPRGIRRLDLNYSPVHTGVSRAQLWLEQNTHSESSAQRTSDPPPQTQLVNLWTPGMEDLARSAARQSGRKAWMYDQMVIKAKTWENALTISSAVISGLVGLEGLVGVVGEESPPLGLQILATFLSFVALVLLTLNNTWKLGEVGQAALSTQVKLLSTKRGIELQLALPAAERQDAQIYMRDVIGEIETMLLGAPTVYAAIARKAAVRFGVSGSADVWGVGTPTAARLSISPLPGAPERAPPSDRPLPMLPLRIRSPSTDMLSLVPPAPARPPAPAQPPAPTNLPAPALTTHAQPRQERSPAKRRGGAPAPAPPLPTRSPGTRSSLSRDLIDMELGNYV